VKARVRGPVFQPTGGGGGQKSKLKLSAARLKRQQMSRQNEESPYLTVIQQCVFYKYINNKLTLCLMIYSFYEFKKKYAVV
jgi:hypothetical protein